DNAEPYEPAQKGPREDFGASFWFSVSVGRKQNAEPRWLIPILCRNGNVTKREIGAIKMPRSSALFGPIAAWKLSA
ncbi:DbpA RNA binding domain-containing protein, partial [Rhizobium ruizarguesonis]